MKSFRETYNNIRERHNHTLKFLNSSIAFIDISSVQNRIEKKGEHAFDNFLTEWEHSYVEQLRTPKRKIDFLSGRLAGKRAVKRHLTKGSGSNPVPDPSLFRNIEIKRTVTGRPLVFIKDGKGRNGSSDFNISISHTEGVAASLVSDKLVCKGIGIDIEKIEQRDRSLLDVAFTGKEISMLNRHLEGKGKADAKYLEEIARYWSIKEAVMKSMGVGVNIDLKDIEIVGTNDYSADINLKNDAVARYELLKGYDMKVESTRIENFMVSIACLF